MIQKWASINMQMTTTSTAKRDDVLQKRTNGKNKNICFVDKYWKFILVDFPLIIGPSKPFICNTELGKSYMIIYLFVGLIKGFIFGSIISF